MSERQIFKRSRSHFLMCSLLWLIWNIFPVGAVDLAFHVRLRGVQGSKFMSRRISCFFQEHHGRSAYSGILCFLGE